MSTFVGTAWSKGDVTALHADSFRGSELEANIRGPTQCKKGNNSRILISTSPTHPPNARYHSWVQFLKEQSSFSEFNNLNQSSIWNFFSNSIGWCTVTVFLLILNFKNMKGCRPGPDVSKLIFIFEFRFRNFSQSEILKFYFLNSDWLKLVRILN